MMSTDRDGQNRLVLKFYADNGTDLDTIHTEVIDPVDISDLIRAITNTGLSCLEGAAKAMVYGDCDTCGNSRLIEQERSTGRMELVYCPDCAEPPKRPGPPFSSYPKPRPRKKMEKS